MPLVMVGDTVWSPVCDQSVTRIGLVACGPGLVVEPHVRTEPGRLGAWLLHDGHASTGQPCNSVWSTRVAMSCQFLTATLNGGAVNGSGELAK